VDGQKLSKSTGDTHDPVEIVDRYGTDALRWWFLRDVPRTGDADFREELLVVRANELADGLGNLVNRTITLLGRYRPQGVGTTHPRGSEAIALHAVINRTPREIDNALARFDFRAATASLWQLVDEANRFVATTRPWELAKGENSGDADAAAELDEVLHSLLVTCRLLARELQPFLPAASARIAHALAESDPQLGRRLFTKAVSRT
jgi:methionyl-tRNA synthetase